jgi:hypothetical protein
VPIDIQHGGDRQQAPGDPLVALDLGQPTQFDQGDVLADQKGGHGRPLDAMHADESRPPASAQAKESAFQPVGISGNFWPFRVGGTTIRSTARRNF